jgi:leader peptidase (prepilin peptidase) / N-methyltransferase
MMPLGPSALLVPSSLPALAALAGTLVAAVVDARTGLIPDALTRTTALAALGCAVANGSVPLACGGAYTVGGALLALHLLTRGRGLGLGDVKLGTAIGVGLGPGAGLVALGGAFVLGGAYASWLLLARRARRGDAVRFGPFLAAGTLVAALMPAAAFA